MASGGILPPDPLFCFRENMGPVHALCFPQRNRDYSDILLAGTEKGDVYFWDLDCNRLQYKQKMGESIQAIHSVGFDIITQEKSGLVKLWSIENNAGYKPQKTFECYGGFCKSILVKDQLFLPQIHGSFEAIDINTFKTVNKYVPDRSPIAVNNLMCLEYFQMNGTEFLLAGYDSGEILVYDFATTHVVSQLSLKESITSVTFDPDTSLGVVGNSGDILTVFKFDAKNMILNTQAEINIPNPGCQIVKFRPDRKLFVAGGWDGRLRIHSWRTLRPLVILAEHKKTISDIQFSPSIVGYWKSKIFASASADGTIFLWNVYHSYTY